MTEEFKPKRVKTGGRQGPGHDCEAAGKPLRTQTAAACSTVMLTLCFA